MCWRSANTSRRARRAGECRPCSCSAAAAWRLARGSPVFFTITSAITRRLSQRASGSTCSILPPLGRWCCAGSLRAEHKFRAVAKSPPRLQPLTRTKSWEETMVAKRHHGIVCAVALLVATASASAQERRDEFYWLSELNKASTVMVVEQGIVPKALGKTIADAVAQVIADAEKPGARRSGAYLQVEPLIIAIGGPDVTRMHSGRSRQDIGATRTRLFQRDQVLSTYAALNVARSALMELAAKHPDAIVPAYTVGVQAQPISFGHYILAYTQALERDGVRLAQAYATVNRSPLGSAALGTSSFPVNRPRLAELLGFDGVIENSLDANQISPIDTGAELVSVAASGALTINTMLADITAQYAQTKPWLMLAEGELTGISSIMPQKRNPTGLVALRTQASRVLGEAQTFMILAHNVAAGMGDYKVDQPNLVLRDASRMLTSFAALMRTFVFDEARARAEVDADYSTTTELADILQRVADVPFRVGHHFASDLVNYGRSNNLKPAEIP